MSHQELYQQALQCPDKNEAIKCLTQAIAEAPYEIIYYEKRVELIEQRGDLDNFEDYEAILLLDSKQTAIKIKLEEARKRYWFKRIEEINNAMQQSSILSLPKQEREKSDILFAYQKARLYQLWSHYREALSCIDNCLDPIKYESKYQDNLAIAWYACAAKAISLNRLGHYADAEPYFAFLFQPNRLELILKNSESPAEYYYHLSGIYYESSLGWSKRHLIENASLALDLANHYYVSYYNLIQKNHEKYSLYMDKSFIKYRVAYDKLKNEAKQFRGETGQFAREAWERYNFASYNEALSIAKNGLKETSDSALLYLILTMAQIQINQITDAIMSLRKYIKLKPNEDNIIDFNELLNLLQKRSVQKKLEYDGLSILEKCYDSLPKKIIEDAYKKHKIKLDKKTEKPITEIYTQIISNLMGSVKELNKNHMSIIQEFIEDEMKKNIYSSSGKSTKSKINILDLENSLNNALPTIRTKLNAIKIKTDSAITVKQKEQINTYLQIIQTALNKRFNIQTPTLTKHALQPIITSSSISVEFKKQAIAKYSFKATRNDELSFIEGEQLIILKNEGNWWLCKLGDKQGLVPSNYLELLNEKKAASVSDSKQSAAEKTNSTLYSVISYAIAKYSFQGRYLDELSFNEKTKLAVLEKKGKWWLCRLDDKQGFVPSNYLEEIVENTVSNNSDDVEKNSSCSEILGMAITTTSFQGENFNELTIDKGIPVWIVEKNYTSGWWKCRTFLEGKNQIGWLPANILLETKENNSSKNIIDSPAKHSSINTTVDNNNKIIKGVDYKAITFGPQIGAGSYGEVFKATYNGNTVAVKKLKCTNFTDKTVLNFKKETEIMRILNSPYIVKLINFTLDPAYCLIMEYVEGQTLYNLINSEKGKNLSWTIVQEIAVKIASGLEYLHACNIQHRDFKTPNILITQDYEIKIVDFGMAKVRQETDTHSTNSMTSGTARWMAPEILRGERYTQKSDMYSFGVILSELATKKPPFKKFPVAAVPMQVLNGNWEESQLANDTPSILKYVIKRNRSLDPNHRLNAGETKYCLQMSLQKKELSDIITDFECSTQNSDKIEKLGDYKGGIFPNKIRQKQNDSNDIYIGGLDSMNIGSGSYSK